MRFLIAVLLLCAAANAQGKDEAIAKGVAWLKSRQAKDGSWRAVRMSSYDPKKKRPPQYRDPTGPTSLALYTLLKCGVKRTDPVIKKGYAWIQGGQKARVERRYAADTWTNGKAWDVTGDRRHYESSSYESAAVVLMLDAMYPKPPRARAKNPLKVPFGSKIPKSDWRWLHERVVWLTVGRKRSSKGRTLYGTQVRSGQHRGGWSYYGTQKGPADLAATHFCLLALRAADRAGYPVTKTSERVWSNAARYCRGMQQEDGGFGYQHEIGNNASMTAAGVVSLLICKEQMQRDGAPVPTWMDGAVHKGLKRLTDLFDVAANRGEYVHMQYHFYYLWTIEQVGALTGWKTIRTIDWHKKGTALLLALQDADGKWIDGTCPHPKDVLGTCFALLFLRRPTPPLEPKR